MQQRRPWSLAFVVSALLLVSVQSARADTTPAIWGSNWMGGQGVNACSMSGTWDTVSCGGQTPVGSAWQCVELPQRLYYTRGWYTQNNGRFIQSPNTPAASAYQIYDGAPFMGMVAYPNGSPALRIVPGDMIVHNHTSGSPDGHVSVVDRIEGATVYAVEQNYMVSGSGTAHLATYTLSGTTLSRSDVTLPIRGVVHSLANTPTTSSSSLNTTLDVFAEASDSTLEHVRYDNGWGSWESLGGTLASSPAVISPAAGVLDVFVENASNGLSHRRFASGAWSAWESLGGTLASAPAAISIQANVLDVFAEASDGSLEHVRYDSGWGSWESLGGTLTSAPSVTSPAAGVMDVFVKNGSNGLSHRRFASGSWSAWESLGGTLASAPAAVSIQANVLDVFAEATDGSLEHVRYDNVWGLWESLGGSLASAPGATSPQSGVMDIFVENVSNGLSHRRFASGAWSAWESLGGTLASAPSAASMG